MNGVPAVSSAVDAGEIVVSCAYRGHVPEDVLAQLPEGFTGTQYVMKLVDGKMVDLKVGVPERVIGSMLPTPVDTSDHKSDCSGEENTVCPPDSEPDETPAPLQ
ncbi:MAG: hypothetical protein ACYTDT_09885 [Planctomycetota bacterium]|jgi:hypothetical protein